MRGLALHRVLHEAEPMTRARMALQLPRLDAKKMSIDEDRVALGEEVPRVVHRALGVYKEERTSMYNGHKVYSLVDKDKEPLVMYFDTMPAMTTTAHFQYRAGGSRFLSAATSTLCGTRATSSAPLRTTGTAVKCRSTNLEWLTQLGKASLAYP